MVVAGIAYLECTTHRSAICAECLQAHTTHCTGKGCEECLQAARKCRIQARLCSTAYRAELKGSWDECPARGKKLNSRLTELFKFLTSQHEEHGTPDFVAKVGTAFYNRHYPII